MLRIIKDTTNTLTLTLTENSTVSNPFYLFEFQNQTSLVKYYFISTDTSQFKQRYNRFSLVERDSPNTLQGQVSLDNEGFYDYKVYQTNLTTLSGLTDAEDAVDNIVKTVEYGRVWVVPNNAAIPTYVGVDSTMVIYNPNGYLIAEDGGFILQENGGLIII